MMHVAPFKRKRRTIAVDPGIRDLFQLIKSVAWPPMMEKYLARFEPRFLLYLHAIYRAGFRREEQEQATEAPSTPNNI